MASVSPIDATNCLVSKVVVSDLQATIARGLPEAPRIEVCIQMAMRIISVKYMKRYKSMNWKYIRLLVG